MIPDYTSYVVVPDADDPKVFNPRVPDLPVAYGGRLGGVWTTYNVKFIGHYEMVGPTSQTHTKRPNAAWDPMFVCMSPITGEIFGDVNKDVLVSSTTSWTDEVDVTNIAAFACGPMYSYGLDTWLPPNLPSDDTIYIASLAWKHTAGMPFFCRQRGNKLWMINAAVYNSGSSAPAGAFEGHAGQVFRVGDIYETVTEPGDSYTGNPAYPNTNPDGKKFEAQYEIYDWFHISNKHQTFTFQDFVNAPLLPGYAFGVGNRYLMFIDDYTYMDRGGWNNSNYWTEAFTTMRIVDPYSKQAWHYNINSVNVDSSHILPIRPAPRDALWCVGRTRGHSELYVGRIDPILEGHTEGNGIVNIPRLVLDTVLVKAGPTLECRSYDRLAANEFRGAHEAILWHDGWKIKDALNMSFYATKRTSRLAFKLSDLSLTAAGIWERKHDLAGTPTIVEHDIFDADYVPLGMCLTPHGDYVYIEHQKISSDEIYWRITRPGYWTLEPRIPSLDGRVGNIAGANNPYSDIHEDDVVGSCNYFPVCLTCNEHWLYIRNMPARVTPIDLGGFNEAAFQSSEFFQSDWSDFQTEYPTIPGEEDRVNVFYNWMIDLYSGTIIIPWRMEYNNNYKTGWANTTATKNTADPSNDLDDVDLNRWDWPHTNCHQAFDTMPFVAGHTPPPTFH